MKKQILKIVKKKKKEERKRKQNKNRKIKKKSKNKNNKKFVIKKNTCTHTYKREERK